MPGVGKTAVANTVFNHLQPGCSVKAHIDVIQADDELSLATLLKKMLGQLCMQSPLLPIEALSTQQLRQRLKERLAQAESLIVLDNVRTAKQLQFLLPEIPKKARVIVTTRNQQLSIEAYGSSPQLVRQQIDLLSTTDSHTLFCLHAFPSADPHQDRGQAPAESAKAIADLTAACDGLPRTIVAVARHLAAADCKDSVLHQTAMILKQLSRATDLSGNRNGTIFGELIDSFMNMSDQDRRAFMDVACVLLGEPEQNACLAWGSDGQLNLGCLRRHSSIDIQNGKLAMQMQLRDLGRSFVHPDASWTWNFRQQYAWDRPRDSDSDSEDEQVRTRAAMASADASQTLSISI